MHPRAASRNWGWDAHIETFQVLYPTPISETLELGDARAPSKATVQEPPVPATPRRATPSDALPAYVAYQGDGDVTAPLVYVNYGMPDDYQALARLGIDVKGKIVIARYGGGWRGPEAEAGPGSRRGRLHHLFRPRRRRLRRRRRLSEGPDAAAAAASSAARSRTCRSIPAIR